LGEGGIGSGSVTGKIEPAAGLDTVTGRVAGFDDEEESQFEGGAVLDEEDEDATIEAALSCDLRLSEAPIVDLIFLEGVCHSEWNKPPLDFGGGKSDEEILNLTGTGEPTILGEYVGLEIAGVTGPEDSAMSEKSSPLTSPGGRAGMGRSSGRDSGTGFGGGDGGRRPSACRSRSTAW